MARGRSAGLRIALSPADWSAIYTVYEAACDLPPQDRTAFVESALRDERLRSLTLDLLTQLEAPEESHDPMPPPAPHEHGPQLLPGSFLGRFQILEEIGRGGMGEVYRAVDTDLGRNVAIKCIAGRRLGPSSAVASFIREARMASALNHPGIVTIYEVIRTQDTVAIVMELMEGESLRKRCGTAQPVERVAAWGRQIAAALAELHAAGLMHRDIKPENLMLRNEDYVKILDFGLARQPTSADVLDEDDYGLAGTVRYMSPEQARGMPLTPATDIFSLGIVLYELAAGVHPFASGLENGNSTLTVAQAIAERNPLPLSSFAKALSPRFTQLVDAMMAKRAAERPSAAEVARRLAEIPATPSVKSRRKFFAIAGASVVMLGFAMYGLRSSLEPPASPLHASLFTGAPGNEADPAFSPDSQWLAYSWDGGEGGRGDIYLKRVAEGDPVRLTTGPGNAWGPTWSPDGSTIAFLRQAAGFVEVAVVPASGGKTRVIAELVQGMIELQNRLTWSGTADEVIVADDPPGKSGNFNLYRVSIRTGERHLLDEAPVGASDLWPRTSPDRRWIAYFSLSGNDPELRVIPAAGGPAAGGNSRLVVSQPGLRALAWGSDSKHLICGFGQSSFDQIREIPLDGGSFHKASFSLQDQSSDLAFSPDGRKVSFVRGSRDSNVWRISTDGAAPLKLTSSTRADEDAVYSPDGMSIAFSSSRTGDYEIWTAASDGTHLRKLTSLGGFSASPSWSPDGRYIAFDSNLLEKPQIRVVPVEGGTARLVAGDMSAMVPSWSRDGRWIYFSSKVTGANELWRVPSGGGKAQQITRRGGFESRESPDGKYLYYSKNGADGIWRMVLPPSAGRAEEQVAAFAPAVQFRCWDVADAGVYVARPGKPPEIHMTPFARGPDAAVVKLTRDLPFYGRCISARPDGRAFLLSIDDAIHREIFVADLPN